VKVSYSIDIYKKSECLHKIIQFVSKSLVLFLFLKYSSIEHFLKLILILNVFLAKPNTFMDVFLRNTFPCDIICFPVKYSDCLFATGH